MLVPGPAGPTAVPGLHLSLGDEGVIAVASDGESVWKIDWDGVIDISTGERSSLPGGGVGVVLDVTVAGAGTQRFVIPADDRSAIDDAVRMMIDRYGSTAAARRGVLRTALCVGVLVVEAAVITVLLLAAGHVIHL